MSKKHFSALLIVAVLVIVAISLLVPERTGRESLPASDLIFPGLGERINEADRLQVVAGGDRTVATLERGEQAWTVLELDGFPANFDTVRNLLAGLARARVIEFKTDNPAYYDRLGVEDVAAEGAGGLAVTVGLAQDEVALIFGKNAEGRDGRYLRPAGSAQSILSDFDALVPDEAVGWVDREITDIASADVVEVVIEHADGDRIHARKASPDDTDFTLVNLPEGRETESSWAVNSLGGALAGLQLDSVRSADAVDWSGASMVRLITSSGMQITVEAVLNGEDHWIRLSAAAHSDGGEEPADESLEEQVSALNDRAAGWAYLIAAYKFEAMTKRLENLLKSPGEANGTQ